MDNYKIIVDELELKNFIDRVLPGTSVDETFYLCLFARNKYCKDVKHISSDKAQLKRFLTSKDRMINKIRQLECPIDAYSQYRKGEIITIPQEALALYIQPNPRDMKKSVVKALKKIADLIETDAHGFNLPQEMMSIVQKTPSKKTYYNVDFDVSKDRFPEIQQTLEGVLNKEAITWVETRGGFHALINLHKVSEEKRKKWYKEVSKIEGVEMRSDDMLPVPGTYQGGFSPKVYYDFE